MLCPHGAGWVAAGASSRCKQTLCWVLGLGLSCLTTMLYPLPVKHLAKVFCRIRSSDSRYLAALGDVRVLPSGSPALSKGCFNGHHQLLKPAPGTPLLRVNQLPIYSHLKEPERPSPQMSRHIENSSSSFLPHPTPDTE